jgi:hypothetical protein
MCPLARCAIGLQDRASLLLSGQGFNHDIDRPRRAVNHRLNPAPPEIFQTESG